MNRHRACTIGAIRPGGLVTAKGLASPLDARMALALPILSPGEAAQ
jgi:hypothetical protein